MQILWKGSPNFDTNRTQITILVIHWFGSGTLEGAHATFQKPNGTSAHYGVSNERVWQWVKEEHVAYHAGNYAMNQRSIGIEHDANPQQALSEQSYQTSAELIRLVCTRHNIPIDRAHIIQHKEIKPTQCPGTIDLDKLIRLAQGGTMPTLYEYLGVTSDADAQSRLKEHLGEFNGKCNWGQEPAMGAENFGGYLGDARRRIKQLEAQPAPGTGIDPNVWVENGLITEEIVSGKKYIRNYKKK